MQKYLKLGLNHQLMVNINAAQFSLQLCESMGFCTPLAHLSLFSQDYKILNTFLLTTQSNRLCFAAMQILLCCVLYHIIRVYSPLLCTSFNIIPFLLHVFIRELVAKTMDQCKWSQKVDFIKVCAFACRLRWRLGW